MRPEIKAAIEALQALENVTTDEYTSIKNEVNTIELLTRDAYTLDLFELIR